MFLTGAAELTLTGCGLTTNAAPCDLTRPQFELCICSLTSPVFVNTTVLPVPRAAAVTLHLRVLIHAFHKQSSGFRPLQPSYDVFKYSLVYFVAISNTDSRVMLFVKLMDQEMWVQFFGLHGSFETFDMTVKLKKKRKKFLKITLSLTSLLPKGVLMVSCKM